MATARLRRAGPILASAVVASIASSAITPVVVHAEAPPKKSIYDDLPVTTLPPKRQSPYSSLDKPTQELASYVRHSRLFLHDKVTIAQKSLDAAFDRYLSLEQSFTSTVASLAPSRGSKEQVLPGSIYIIVSAMAGGVLSRNRMFPIRALTPLAAAVGASWYFLPETTRNVADLLWKYEQKYPQVAEAHLNTRKTITDSWDKGNAFVHDGKKAIEGKLNQGRETIESWIRRQ